MDYHADAHIYTHSARKFIKKQNCHIQYIKKYSHIHMKETECEPWDILCIDLIGEYTLNAKERINTLCLSSDYDLSCNKLVHDNLI